MKMLRKIFKIPKKVSIEWSYPLKVDAVLSQIPDDKSWGLYQISTKTESGITFLYIGKSWKNYHKRLKSHKSGKKAWFDNYLGEKYVRFASFHTRITEKQLDEIESAVIFETKFIENTQSTISYNVSHEYEIKSNGNRGKVPSIIKTIEH
jgi:predicted GIY-YIG superfamily endonuclease